MWRPVKGTRRKIEIERQGAIPHRLPINDAGDASDTVRECGVVGWVTIGLGIAGGDFGRRRRQLCHSPRSTAAAKARSSVETTRLRVSGREQSSFARYPTLSQSAQKDGPPGAIAFGLGDSAVRLTGRACRLS